MHDLDRRRVFFHPRLFKADPWVIRHVVNEEVGHLLTGSVSDETALRYVACFHAEETQPEEAVLRWTPDRILTDDMLELVWERHGLQWWDVEELANAEGISSRELCLMFLAGEMGDEWLMAA